MDTFFLLSICICGIKNIENPIIIPFYKKTIKHDFNPTHYRVKGIYGENGSGKTAVMIAVRILTRILLDRNYLSDSVNQRLLVENINKKTRKSFLEVTFYSRFNGIAYVCHYRVDFEIKDDGRVYLTREKLEKKLGDNSQAPYMLVYETRNGNIFRPEKGELFVFLKEKTKNLLEQRSLISFVNEIDAAGYHLRNKPERYLWILAVFASRIYVEIDGEDEHKSDVIQRLKSREAGSFHENEDLAILSWASAASRDRKDIMIPKSQLQFFEKETGRLFAFIRIFKSDLRNIELEKKEYGEFFVCRRVMVYDGYKLDEEYESKGIKKLMRLFDTLDAACRGDIVFIDELDSSINDVYLDKLIEYFVYYGKGQLCFTAHNLSPMSVLRNSKCAISFISGVNTIHTWTSNGNQNPEHAYRDGFIDDSPFNVDSSDFLGILGGSDE